MNPSNRFLTKMLAIDPSYGQKKHQRGFLARIDRCDVLQPCTKPEPDHMHTLDCYPTKVKEQAAREIPS